tara:strand:+ start:44975 stop:45175 length:201 start_codon:yes stop_codon:yes gene_type:complete
VKSVISSSQNLGTFSETGWESVLNEGTGVDVMSNFLEVAIVSTNQVTKVKQLNTKQLAEIQFDYGF